MAGVLSKPATRLAAAAAARPASIFLTVTRRPSAFASPHAAIPRFIHSKVTPDPRLELTPEVKAEITRMVREAVQAETMGIKATCLERYEKLSTDQISQGEVSASRHAESMLESIRSQKRLGHIGFSVWVSVVGLSAAAQYKAEISKFIMGNGPPSEEEVDKMVDDKVKAYTDSVVRQEVRSVCAEHFQKEQSIKDPQKKDS